MTELRKLGLAPKETAVSDEREVENKVFQTVLTTVSNRNRRIVFIRASCYGRAEGVSSTESEIDRGCCSSDVR